MSYTDRLSCFWVSRSAVMRTEWRTEAMGESWKLSRYPEHISLKIRLNNLTASERKADRDIFPLSFFLCFWISEQCVCVVTQWRRWWALRSMAALQGVEECPPVWVERVLPIAALSATGTRWALQATVPGTISIRSQTHVCWFTQNRFKAEVLNLRVVTPNGIKMWMGSKKIFINHYF